MKGDDEKYRIRAISRAFEVLTALNAETPALTLDELQRKVGFSKSSLLRVLRTLELEGVVVTREERYTLGPRLLHFAHQFLNQTSLPQSAKRHFPALVRRHGLTASLAILDHMEVVYLAVENPNLELGLQATIGKRHPAHATAVGKVLLAALPADELRRRLVATVQARLTEKTITDPEALERELGRVHMQGYALDDEERGVGIRCVAVPVRNAAKTITAAISLAGPIFHCKLEKIDDYLSTLRDVSATLSHEIGFEAPLEHGRP